MVSLLALLTLLGALPAGPPWAGIEDTELVLGAGATRRCFRLDERGAPSTIRIEGGAGALPVAAREFRLVLADGTVLEPDGFEDVSVEPLPGDVDGEGFAVRHGAGRETYRVLALYWQPRDSAVLHKQLRLSAAGVAAPPPRLDVVEVERFLGVFTGGGRGLPATGPGGCFLGLEHPAAHQVIDADGVTLRHHPGSEPRRIEEDADTWEYPPSLRAVLGMGRDGEQGTAALEHYVASLWRPLELKTLLAPCLDEATSAAVLETRWGDWAESLAGTRPAGVDLLLDPWGGGEVPLAIDHVRFPDQLAPLADQLGALDSRLALAIPFGDGPPARVASLGNPVERRVLLLRIVELLREARPTYVEHRLPPADSTAPTDAAACAAAERRVDGLLEILRFERRVDPQILLGASTCSPISPWWWPHVDVVRPVPLRPASPQPTPTLADQIQGALDGGLFPCLAAGGGSRLPPLLLTALEGGCLEPDDPSTLADAGLLGLARGLAVQEIAFDPDRLTDSGREVLRQLERWRASREELLTVPRWYGGDPRRGELYGFLHGTAERRILVARNPGPRPAPLDLPAAEVPWLRTYPWCELIEDGPPLLEGFEVACFETVGAVPHLREVPAGARFTAGERHARTSSYEVILAPGTRTSVAWLDAATGAPTGRTSEAGLSRRTGQRRPGEEPQLTGPPPSLRRDGTLHLPIEGITRHAGEHWTLTLVLHGAELPTPALEAIGVADGKRPVLRSGPTWVHYCCELEPTDDGEALEVTVAGLDPARTTAFHLLALVTRRVELEAVRLAISHDLRSAAEPILPPQRRAHEQRRSFVVHDGTVAPPRALRPAP